MDQVYTGFGYILLKFERDLPKTEKKKITEEIVRLGDGDVQTVEFPKSWIFYKSKTYDAAARFETPSQERLDKLLEDIGKIKGIRSDRLCIRYISAIKPFIRFYELEQL